MHARILKRNQDAVAKLFPSATFELPDPTWHGGCSDPECCGQHPGLENMIGVNIPNMSGQQFHRALVKARVVVE